MTSKLFSTLAVEFWRIISNRNWNHFSRQTQHHVRSRFTLKTALLILVTTALQVDLPKPATPSDAVGWALADLVSLPESDRPFVRYVWIPPWGNDDWPAAINFAVNTAASSSRNLQFGAIVANGWMMRYDLRRLAPNPTELIHLQLVWDGLAVDDPYFHVPRDNSGLAVAVLAPHLSQQHAAALADLSWSTGAIYRADWFLSRMLTTLDGGRYYDFSGANRAAQVAKSKKGSSAQAEFLAALGVFEGSTRELAADQRAAIFRSGVTGKPRRIDFFNGLQRNAVAITHDVFDEDVGARFHPLRNLIDFQDRAREVIVQRPNGMHAFALFDASGALQSSVPDNIARDHTIPAPHTGRLQPAIGCIRCHGSDDGWKPFGNDVARILSSRLDVFGDVGVLGLTREEVVDRLAFQYAGQLDVPDGPVGRARRDYSAAVYRIATSVKPLAVDVKPVPMLSDLIGSIHAQYRYDLVTPERAALELGARSIEDVIEKMGTGPVDPIAGMLISGIPINRRDFEQIYADMVK